MNLLIKIAIFLLGKEVVEDILNGKKSLYLCDPVTAMVVIGVTTVAATAGTAAYSAHQEKKQQKKLLEYQEEQVIKAEQKSAQAETLATEQAKEAIKKKRRSITQTVFTSPLGTMEEANIGTRSLLGGV